MSAYSDQVLADGAVAYWRFNESTGSMLDQLGNNDFDSVTGATRNQAGVLADDADTSVSFARAGKLQRTGTPVGIPTGSQARSFECWFKSANTTNVQTLLGYGDGTPPGSTPKNQWVVALNDSSRGLVVSTWAPGDVWFGTAHQWSDGQWHHLVVTYDGSTTCELYIDAVSQGTQSFSIALNTVNANLVAATLYYTPGIELDGSLDEMALYDSVLTESQVQNHYSLAHSFALAGSISGASTVSGQLNAITPISASVAGDSSGVGVLSLTRGLMGTAIGSASSVANTVITRALSGLSTGLATLTGLLHVNNPARDNITLSSTHSIGTLAKSRPHAGATLGSSTSVAADLS